MQVKRPLEVVKTLEYIRQSELAELNGVRPSTVKYYSELGLLPYQQHGEGLSKFYHRVDASKRLQEILKLKKQGKTINEIITRFAIT
jgi:DNA-binding transcriptional MerR regulator